MNIHMARPGPAGPGPVPATRLPGPSPRLPRPGAGYPAAGPGAGCRLPGRPFFGFFFRKSFKNCSTDPRDQK